MKGGGRGGFNWSKFTFVCGNNSQLILGENGCLCPSPCRWRQRWVRSSKKVADMQAYHNLMQENPKEEYL